MLRLVPALILVLAAPAFAQEAEEAPPPAPPESPEMPAPPPAAQPVAPSEGDEITLEDWNRPDWALVQPKVSLLELGGYYRFRTDMLRKLDFEQGAKSQNNWAWEYRAVERNETTWTWEGAPRYRPSSNGKADFTYADMRLRLEPEINVSEDIHVLSTLDVFDNLVLGSTPQSFFTDSPTPNNLENGSTTPLVRGGNSVRDAILVKRLWGRVTALNEQLELRVGRMPNHWGLGMLANSGDCLDCDDGQQADRLALSFKAANHVFSPMYDYVSSGPVDQPFANSTDHQIDAATWDDVSQFSLQVLRLDHPEEIRDQLAADQTVLNYGAWVIYRTQARDVPAEQYRATCGEESCTDETDNDGDGAIDENVARGPGSDLVSSGGERRDAQLFVGDAFANLYVGNLRLGIEGAVIWGTFRDCVVPNIGEPCQPADPSQPSDPTDNDVFKWGAALELDYALTGDYSGASLGLMAGAASGDSAPGFGSLDRADTQRGIFGPNQERDTDLNNFQFSPDYHVDRLVFRRMIGTVTDAWYVRPEVRYDFDPNVNGELGIVYSQAFFKRSTASCFDPGQVRCRSASGEGSARPMALEIDGELAYGKIDSPEGGPLRASIGGALAFPFGAFKNLDAEENDQGGSFAWTILTRLYIVF